MVLTRVNPTAGLTITTTTSIIITTFKITPQADHTMVRNHPTEFSTCFDLVAAL